MHTHCALSETNAQIIENIVYASTLAVSGVINLADNIDRNLWKWIE